MKPSAARVAHRYLEALNLPPLVDDNANARSNPTGDPEARSNLPGDVLSEKLRSVVKPKPPKR